MKKSFVALLIGLGLIVLISPGIVGRLAEKSMDENLDWAATETDELVVSSQGFDRGWFSSEGRHRIEIREGDLRDLLLAYMGTDAAGGLPTLIIDTRLDHGLIPVASMTRDKGSLVPGLGSAVSTLTIESGSGEVVPLPGTIYSTVSLTGELTSNYLLESGSYDRHGATATWGDVDIKVTTSPTDGNLDFDGSIASFAVTSVVDDVRIDDIRFSGEQQPSAFGFRVGPVRASVRALAFDAGLGQSIGPITVEADSAVDGDRVTARTQLRVESAPLQGLGDADVRVDVRLVDADGHAAGTIKRKLERMEPGASQDALMLELEADARRLFAAGLELHVDEASIALPQGNVSSQLHVVVVESDRDFAWTQLLLAIDASADISIDETLVQLAVDANPEFAGAIGAGFLKKSGDTYEMHLEFRQGLLTVNGAPMPLPLPAVQ